MKHLPRPVRMSISLFLLALIVFNPLYAVEYTGTKNEDDRFSITNPNSGATQPQELSLEVNVVGAILSPGTYRLPVLSRVTDALAAAGGVLPEGSPRALQVRSGKEKSAFDLLRFTLYGDLKNNPYIQNGDLVFVPFKTRAVRILGPVRHQGDYDALHEKTLQDLVDLLGGFTTGYDENGAFMVSRLGKEDVEQIALGKDELASFDLQDGDVILTPHITRKNVKYQLRVSELPGEVVVYPDLEQNVFVIGGVLKPGAYKYYPNLEAREYIALAGGHQTLAYKNDVRIISPGDKQVKEYGLDSVPEGAIIPGSVIEVEQREIPPQFWISFMATLASIGLSAAAIFTR